MFRLRKKIMNNPPDTEFYLDISKISIPKPFLRTPPSLYKYREYRNSIESNGVIDRAIEVTTSKKGYIYVSNNYIRLLVCEDLGIENIPCKWSKEEYDDE